MEPIWFTADQIERLNAIIVEASGETHFVLSRSLLESAVARPQNLFHYEAVDDLIVLAVRLIEAIARNHCFEQGNKRTAFHAGIAFLDVNGVDVGFPDTEASAILIEGLVTGAATADDVIALFRSAAPPQA